MNGSSLSCGPASHMAASASAADGSALLARHLTFSSEDGRAMIGGTTSTWCVRTRRRTSAARQAFRARRAGVDKEHLRKHNYGRKHRGSRERDIGPHNRHLDCRRVRTKRWGAVGSSGGHSTSTCTEPAHPTCIYVCSAANAEQRLTCAFPHAEWIFRPGDLALPNIRDNFELTPKLATCGCWAASS